MASSDLHNPQRIRALFDEMAPTYGIVNLVSSLGFSWRWRRQALEQVPFPVGGRVADLMSGSGELWPSIAKRVRDGSILAVDISPEMNRRARAGWRATNCRIEIRVADVLTIDLDPASIDVVVSTFGLKTLSSHQLVRLAELIKHVLRPGGVFSFLEISVPPNPILRAIFMFYVCRIIPVVGRMFRGNSDNYRMLGAYTWHFGSAQAFLYALRNVGLHAEYRSYFYGCATGVVGVKPAGA